MNHPKSPIPVEYKLGFHDDISYRRCLGKGISQEAVKKVSAVKGEDPWMRRFRLKAWEKFLVKPLPTWGGDLSGINFAAINYYLSSTEKKVFAWQDLPPKIKRTYEKIGVPRAERKVLAGVEAQYDSESIYGSIKKQWEAKGIIFTDTDTALKKYPRFFKKYFGRLVPPEDNKFAALNSAFWSGGSFVYVPKGVTVELPLSAYFRINARNLGQFERTLIIADEGSSVHYVEGCSAPIYHSDALHAAVVEIFVKKGASVQYTTIQNWSGDVYNLVTKRARVEEGGSMSWVDVNIGSKITMKYPSCLLVGRGARGEMLSLAIAGRGQHQDTGAKMIHLAPETASSIISKSVSLEGGRATYRGLIKIPSGGRRARAKMKCESLLLDEFSQADTYPVMQIAEKEVNAGHEATVSQIEDEQLCYLQSRGLSREEAESLIISGFAEPIIKRLPMEYALELNRLIQLEIQKGVS